jgi:four helix bundle protein
MMQSEIPILQKTYDFYRELYLVVEKIPKKDKYTLGEKIENTTLDLMEYLIAASYSSKEKKNAYLSHANIKLDLLKTLIRLAEDLRAIPTKKYLQLEDKLQEIGKMLGGWIRSTKAS